jgi:hypothetical protein
MQNFKGAAAAASFLVMTMASNASGGELLPRALTGEALFDDYGADAGSNISGVVCLDGQNCLVVADELIAVQRITLNKNLTGYIPGETFEGAFSQCIDPAAENCPEWDLEAIARDGNRVYVTGSMGFARKKVKFDPDRWAVATFNTTANGSPTGAPAQKQTDHSRLKQVFNGFRPDLSRYVDKPLQCGGVNIEGLAHLNGTLYFGLRSPSDRKNGRTYIVSAQAKSLFTNGAPLNTELHVISFKDAAGAPIKNIGIRALEKLGDRLIIATGDAGVADATKQKHLDRREDHCRALPGGGEHTNRRSEPRMQPRLWIWKPGTSTPKEIGRIGGAFGDQKLEGMAVFNRVGENVDLLLTFDNPDSESPLAILKALPIPN